MTRKNAGGPPNGACENCGKNTPSLRSEYCSKACRSEARLAKQREEYYNRMVKDEDENED